jgi:hypothetical protein
MRAPDPNQPADDRIAAVIGTATDTRQREVVTGQPEELARRIIRLLEELGYIG